MKKRVSLLISLILVVGMLFTACGGSGGDGETIKVGWVGPLTGDQAPWGVCESQMLQLLVDEQNEAGGLLGMQIELIKYDTKGDTQEAINVTKRLASQDGVVTIFGPNSSGPAIAMQSVLTDNKVPGIATVATNPSVTIAEDGSVLPYNFRVCFIDPYQGAVMGGYATDKLGATTAAAIFDVGSDYGEGFTQYFVEEFEANGGTVVAQEGYKTGDTDFRAQLTKIKAEDPDVLLVPAYYKEVSLIANQARELGIDAILLGGDGWASEELYELTNDGASIEGSFIANHFDPTDPKVAPVTDMYKAAYGDDAGVEINAYMVNDAWLVFKAAIEHAGEANGEAIAAALVEVEVEGVTGIIKLGADTHNPEGKQAAILEYKAGESNPIFVEQYSPN